MIVHNSCSKILHVLDAKSDFTNRFACFIQGGIGKKHFFCPIGHLDDILLFKKNIYNCVDENIIYDKNNYIISIINIFRIVKILLEYDVIIWHSLFINHFVLYFLVIFYKRIVNKSIWFVWGGDLYDTDTASSMDQILYKKFIQNLNSVIVNFEGDVDYLRKKFKFNKPIYFGWYGPPSLYGYDLSNNDNYDNDEIVYVQIGHSANRTLEHCKILKLLTKYRNQSIKIVLPINYGDLDYAKEVSNYALELFSREQLLILDRKITLDEYNKILSRVNVCIVDSTRQIALGNLYYHLGHNKSVYLNNSGVMYKYWRSIGLDVRNIEDINKIDNVLDLIFDCKNSNNNHIINRYDDKYWIELWQKNFNSIIDSFSN